MDCNHQTVQRSPLCHLPRKTRRANDFSWMPQKRTHFGLLHGRRNNGSSCKEVREKLHWDRHLTGILQNGRGTHRRNDTTYAIIGYMPDYTKKPNNTYKNKEWLYQKYWLEKLSVSKLAKEARIGVFALWYWMDKLKIPRRNQKQATADYNRTLQGSKN